MSDDQMKARQGLPSEAKAEDASTPDERDATIERLERAIEEERQHSATLLKSVEELRFKTGILEQSYAKQLEDARLRGETAEGELEELKARMAELEAAHEDALELLAKARKELERSPVNRGQLRRAFAASTDGIAKHDAESQVEYDGSRTINKLMSDLDWADDEKPVRPEIESSEAPDQDVPAEEMISPELVLTKDDD